MAKSPEARYTSEFKNDDLYELLNCKNHPEYFISKYVKVTNCDTGLTNIRMNKVTLRMLARIHKNKKVLINKTRQTGCSIINCAYILWYSIFNSNRVSVILAPNLSISESLLDIIREMNNQLPELFKQTLVVNNVREIRFYNGSIIKATSIHNSLNQLRGYSINHLYIDEITFIDSEKLKILFSSILPVIFSINNSKLILSSGNYNHNFSKEIVEKLISPGFVVCKIPWHFIPGLTTIWKLETIINIGWDAWNSEFEV